MFANVLKKLELSDVNLNCLLKCTFYRERAKHFPEKKTTFLSERLDNGITKVLKDV